MKVYDIAYLASQHDGEYILGRADLHTHACYLIYGVLKPHETGRKLKAGSGHEEILCIAHGEVVIRSGAGEVRLGQGQAIHVKGEETYAMDNVTDAEAVYVIAGGHSEGHAH